MPLNSRRAARAAALSLALAACEFAAAASIDTAASPTVPVVPAPAPSSPKPSAPPQFQFVSVARAAAIIEKHRAQVIDTRPLAKHLAGHIAGAIHLPDELTREASGSLPSALLPTDRLAQLFARLGIDSTRPAVVYADHDDPLRASLVAYALLKAGHTQVRILDGGFVAWHGSHPVTQEHTNVVPTTWAATPNTGLSAALADIKAAIDTGEAQLIDARPPKLFRGETRAWQRNGHIPGATNLDWHTLVSADNESLLKSPAELKKAIDAAALEPTNETIVYCGTGREATLLFLHLKHTAKWPRVRLYEGSWTEYAAHADLPVATGNADDIEVHSDGEMSTSGQPSLATLQQLADRGVTLVINCRTPGEKKSVDFSESASAAALGMKYEEIPLGGTDGYDPADVEKLHTLLTAHGDTKSVHMHCAGGPRASTLWAAYLVKHRGLTPQDAMKRVRDAGMLRPTSFERLVGETLMPAKASAAPAEAPSTAP
jgi:thiosulfate/3-mercaptopyruvate sulfurtransferase